MIGRHTNLADRVTLCISHGKHDMITIVVALDCVTDAYRYMKALRQNELVFCFQLFKWVVFDNSIWDYSYDSKYTSKSSYGKTL